MLYYFKCQKCQNTSGLYLKSELPSQLPSCNVCKASGGSVVDQLTSMAFFFGCAKCQGTYSYVSANTYAQEKASRPDCPKCMTNAHVHFVPPDPKQKQKEVKRRRPGIVNTLKHDVSRELALKQESGLANKRRRADDDFQDEEELFEVVPVQDADTQERIRLELDYRQQKKRRKDFDTKHGALQAQHDPLRTSQHPHRVVSFADYQTNLTTHTKKVGSATYPRGGAQGPVLVNGSRVVSVDHTWDYRELGPNSFLRRLCSLLYVLDYGSTDSMNPVELQAMWAAGSLFISCNNYSFTEKILANVRTDGTLKAFLAKIDLSKAPPTGTYPTRLRNFSSVHAKKLPEYKADFVANTEQSYPDYFLYRWRDVFNQLRDALVCTQIKTLTIQKNGDAFTDWTSPPVQQGRVYFVLPEQTRGTFKKKKVHAEQLFYPILMELERMNHLSSLKPAFIGGVKTPCRTCSMVLQKALIPLGDKLILPTDAFGHYWEYSGMHLSNPTFNPASLSMVFGKDTTSDNIYSTECPPSPERS